VDVADKVVDGLVATDVPANGSVTEDPDATALSPVAAVKADVLVEAAAPKSPDATALSPVAANAGEEAAEPKTPDADAVSITDAPGEPAVALFSEVAAKAAAPDSPTANTLFVDESDPSDGDIASTASDPTPVAEVASTDAATAARSEFNSIFLIVFLNPMTAVIGL
jgi:hypothetical protein